MSPRPSKSYIDDFIVDDSILEKVEETDVEEKTVKKNETRIKKVKVKCLLNIREKDDSNSKILDRVTKDTVLDFIGKANNGFINIKTQDGVNGYVMSNYVEF